MSEKRRYHSPESNTRIALEAPKGIKPVLQIASENEIHPVQVSQWRQERMSEFFERKAGIRRGPGPSVVTSTTSSGRADGAFVRGPEAIRAIRIPQPDRS